MNDFNREGAGGMARVDVVVPVLNEREMLPEFMERTAALPVDLRLIFVDNGSNDGTLEYLSRFPGARVIEHGRNLGYGRSLVDGMEAATAGIVIIIDADCEYPPEAIPEIAARIEGGASVVYASRFLAGDEVDMSWLRATGNRMLTRLFNVIYRQGITDLYTGMKGMKRDAYRGISFDRDGFEHVAELAARLARQGNRIEEVPVEYSPRSTGRSKMRHLPELMKALGCLAFYRVVRHA